MALSIICALLVGALIYSIYQAAQDRKEWALERGALLQRIQSPEIAVAESIERPERKPVPVVGVDDDEAYAKAREQRMSGGSS